MLKGPFFWVMQKNRPGNGARMVDVGEINYDYLPLQKSTISDDKSSPS